jgi:hypothetical protein
VLLAIILGVLATFAPSSIQGLAGITTIVFVVLGLIVGLLNIKDKHITDFLVAAIAVAMVGGVAGGLNSLDLVIKPVGTMCVLIVTNIVAMAVAAALVVGLKQIFALAKTQD